MIMTRETDYAVRILRALSCGERLTVRQVCDSELVPVQFAYKILKKLASCGYVEIFRGQEGGCRLKADLNELSLYDLMRCINEDILSMPAWIPSMNVLGGVHTAACAVFTAALKGSRERSRSC